MAPESNSVTLSLELSEASLKNSYQIYTLGHVCIKQTVMYIAWQESLQGFIIVPILCGFPEMLSAPHQHKTAALTPSDQFHHQHTYLLPLPSKVLCQSLLFCLISHLNCCKSVLDTDCITGLLYKSIIYLLLHFSKWFDCGVQPEKERPYCL